MIMADKDLFDTFLKDHLSQKSYLYDQILSQIVSFCILGNWDEKSGNRHFLDEKSDENDKVAKTRQKRKADGVTSYKVTLSLDDWSWIIIYTRRFRSNS